MKTKNTSRGFTLVELLVVIVVLAIIMVLVTPAITAQMDKAKQGALETFAKRALNQAMEMHEADKLLERTEESCYTMGDLGNVTDSTFTGTVKLSGGTWKVYVTDGTFTVNGRDINQTMNSSKTTLSSENSTCP